MSCKRIRCKIDVDKRIMRGDKGGKGRRGVVSEYGKLIQCLHLISKHQLN